MLGRNAQIGPRSPYPPGGLSPEPLRFKVVQCDTKSREIKRGPFGSPLSLERDPAFPTAWLRFSFLVCLWSFCPLHLGGGQKTGQRGKRAPIIEAICTAAAVFFYNLKLGGVYSPIFYLKVDHHTESDNLISFFLSFCVPETDPRTQGSPVFRQIGFALPFMGQRSITPEGNVSNQATRPKRSQPF